jgi:O-methyltransferase
LIEQDDQFISGHTPAITDSPEELYLDLLKRTLSRALIAKKRERHTISPGRLHLRIINKVQRAMLSPMNLELVQLKDSKYEDYVESSHAAYNRTEDAETMIGLKQLDQMQACISDVIKNNVPGDLIEAGVWRGGMTIFMRGAMKALGDKQRRLWIADSFEGLPDPEKDADSFGWEEGAMAVSEDQMSANFERYGLLDDQVVFLKGFFSDTLPGADIDKLSVLRVDADLYESTLDVLNALNPKLSVGGYAIFDDYQNLKDCQRAIDEYRAQHNISDPFVITSTNGPFTGLKPPPRPVSSLSHGATG